MDNLFQTAAQKKFRFDAPGGALTTEDLFDLPLTSKAGKDLNSIAIHINRQLKAQAEESFVETSSNPLKGELGAKLDILKTVIGIKQAANEARRLAAENADKARRLEEAIYAAENRELSSASVDDLKKQLAALRG